MKVRYFGADNLNEPVGADGQSSFDRVYRGEFDVRDYLLGEYRWDPGYNRWIRTDRVSAWWFIGEGSLSEIGEERALAFIEANRPRNEAGEVVDEVRFGWLADYLMKLPVDEAWFNNFNFAQWGDAAFDEAVVGYCQVLRVDESNWWVEFSSDEFNNPKLNEAQKRAILAAGFAEPEPGESPNYWLKMPSVDARAVVALIERVFNGGFMGEGN